MTDYTATEDEDIEDDEEDEETTSPPGKTKGIKRKVSLDKGAAKKKVYFHHSMSTWFLLR